MRLAGAKGVRAFALSWLTLLSPWGGVRAQVAAPNLPVPLDTVTVPVSEGLARVLNGSYGEYLNSNVSGYYARDLVLRAEFLGESEDAPALLEIARQASSGTLNSVLGVFALEGYWAVGGDPEGFVELIEVWDQNCTSGSEECTLRWSDQPAFIVALSAARYLEREPTPRAVAVLDSMRRVHGASVFSTNHVGALQSRRFTAQFDALPSDTERAEKSVFEAMRGWHPVEFSAPIYSSIRLTLLPGLGRKWLRDLSSKNPSAVASAIAAMGQRVEDSVVDEVRDEFGVEPTAGDRTRAAEVRLELVRYLSAYTSPAVRSRLVATGDLDGLAPTRE